MNERIEQEYLDRKVDEWQSEHLDFRGVAQTARYFYNLALADVRGEMERRIKILEPYKDTFESAAACRQELIWLKDFIDNLTK